jgi:hypothetical protein
MGGGKEYPGTPTPCETSFSEARAPQIREETAFWFNSGNDDSNHFSAAKAPKTRADEGHEYDPKHYPPSTDSDASCATVEAVERFNTDMSLNKPAPPVASGDRMPLTEANKIKLDWDSGFRSTACLDFIYTPRIVQAGMNGSCVQDRGSTVGALSDNGDGFDPADSMPTNELLFGIGDQFSQRRWLGGGFVIVKKEDATP